MNYRGPSDSVWEFNFNNLKRSDFPKNGKKFCKRHPIFFKRIANQPCTSIQEWKVDDDGEGKR